jgi:acetyl esterase/lipase
VWTTVFGQDSLPRVADCSGERNIVKTAIVPLDNEGVTLTTYLLDASDEMPNVRIRPAVLIFPGGGYSRCSDREAEPVAMAFLAEGYHAFVLRYSVGESAAFPKSLSDAEEALELLRAKSADWGVEPGKIAVCGFSAGGHLAAALGTMGRVRPNALILGYPCILESMSETLAFPVPSLEQKVDPQTPPTFLFATANDARVPVKNSLAFAVALDLAGTPFELHVFQDGAHGLSLAKAHTSSGLRQMVNPEFAAWIDLCHAWLIKLFGGFPSDLDVPAQASVPKFGPNPGRKPTSVRKLVNSGWIVLAGICSGMTPSHAIG